MLLHGYFIISVSEGSSYKYIFSEQLEITFWKHNNGIVDETDYINHLRLTRQLKTTNQNPLPKLKYSFSLSENVLVKPARGDRKYVLTCFQWAHNCMTWQIHQIINPTTYHPQNWGIRLEMSAFTWHKRVIFCIYKLNMFILFFI